MASIGQTLFGNQGWIQGALTNTFNNLQGGYGTGLDWARNASAPVTNMAPTGMQQASQFLYGTPEGYPGTLTNIEDVLRQYGDLSALSPYFYQNALGDQGQNYLNTLMGAGGQLGDLANYSNYYMGQGGQTDATRSIYDRAMEMAQGQGAYLGTMGDVGASLLGNRGQTAYTQNLQDVASQGLRQAGAGLQSGQNYANQMLAAGGQSPITNYLTRYGSNVLGNGTGLTAAGQAGEAAALQQLQSGGGSPLLDRFQQLAMQNVGQDVVPQNLVGREADIAGRQALGAGEAAYRKALARGGGPGAITGYGGQNQVASEYENEIMAAQAAARQKAIETELNAKLQQQQLAANYGLSAAGQQNQNLGTSGNLLTGLENMATGRLNTGISGLSTSGELSNQQVLAALQNLPTYANAQANAANIYGNLGLNAAGQETSNMSLGGNLLNQYNTLRQGGLSQAGNAAGLENNMFLGAGGLSNNLYSAQGGLTNNALSQLLSGYNTGVSQGNNLFGNYSNLIGNRLTGANTASNLYGTNIGAMNTAAGQGMDLARTGLSGQSQLWGGQQTGGLFPTLLQAGMQGYANYKG